MCLIFVYNLNIEADSALSNEMEDVMVCISNYAKFIYVHSKRDKSNGEM